MTHYNIQHLPVKTAHCNTCPFTQSHAGTVALQSTIVERMLSGGSQICHSTEGPGREPRSLCRGARDRMLMLFCRIGFIEAATDECWQKKREEIEGREVETDASDKKMDNQEQR
jgi:hypothetical protein